MDYLHFTLHRTRFLRYFYTQAAKPFVETRRKIEAFEEPFVSPPGYEDAEPPYLVEWEEAGDALDVLGQAVACFLAATLHLYLQHWIGELLRHAGKDQLREIGIGLPGDSEYRSSFRRGWLAGYQEYCERLGVLWSDSAVDLSLLEQLVLARNTSQHPRDITSVRVRQSGDDAVRFPDGYFVDSLDLRMNESLSDAPRFLLPPRLDLSADKLTRALDEVEAFCNWLDARHPLRPSSR